MINADNCIPSRSGEKNCFMGDSIADVWNKVKTNQMITTDEYNNVTMELRKRVAAPANILPNFSSGWSIGNGVPAMQQGTTSGRPNPIIERIEEQVRASKRKYCQIGSDSEERFRQTRRIKFEGPSVQKVVTKKKNKRKYSDGSRAVPEILGDESSASKESDDIPIVILRTHKKTKKETKPARIQTYSTPKAARRTRDLPPPTYPVHSIPYILINENGIPESDSPPKALYRTIQLPRPGVPLDFDTIISNPMVFPDISFSKNVMDFIHYHRQQEKGKVEDAIKTINKMLAIETNNGQIPWDSVIPKLVSCFNITPSK